MSDPDVDRRGGTWAEHNKQSLLAALAEIRTALEVHASSSAEVRAGSGDMMPAGTQAVPALPPRHAEASALNTLSATFGLSPFERSVLVLCAGVELDAGLATVCARAQGDPARDYPTFSLALAALPDAHWSALTPDAPLRRWRLVEVTGNGPLTTSPLRIDERVLHYLAGVEHRDARLAGFLEVEPHDPSVPIVASHARLVERVTAAWTNCPRGSRLPVIQLCGGDLPGKRGLAAAACATMGLGLMSVRAASLPLDTRELDLFVRLCEREAALSTSVLLLDCNEVEGADAAREAAVSQIVEGMDFGLILLVRERRPNRNRQAICLDVDKPTTAEQLGLWREWLDGWHLNGTPELLVSQFDLGARSIRDACTEAMVTSDDPSLGFTLWDACRTQARPHLDGLAQRVDSRAGWEALVLPPPQLATLRALAAQVRHRGRVYESWGFSAQGNRGLGISALFAGGSGTGKTLAAEVLAGELRLDLYRIDLSQVVSKYIGETEKNLRRVFDAAEEGGAVLLFDEADALFGKRSEVKDAHDRYANIEVGYLLQRMEAYRGLAVLTTNLKGSLDSAFLRRIRFVVQFPFPDQAARAEIWRRIFPTQAPLQDVDTERLAGLNVAGGSIRNIALNAAFLAAEEGTAVCMSHLLEAARAEYAKLERTLTTAEVAGWG
jgi:hypothetical protein